MPESNIENAASDRALADIEDVIEDAIGRGVFSGVQVEVGRHDGVLANLARGHVAFEAVRANPAPVRADTRFDVASLTKAAATSLLAMRALDEGAWDLDTTVREVLGAQTPLHPELGDVTVERLLRHQSGLVDWVPFFEALDPDEVANERGLQRIRAMIASRGLEPGPVVERYSDLGYILLAWMLEERLGQPFELLFDAHVAEPLALERTQFVPVIRGAAALQGAVTTEVVEWRQCLVDGVVHDGNTWGMGGVSGHAGLFSTASDIGTVLRALLAVDNEGRSWISKQTLRTFWDRRWRGEGHYLLGWDTPSGEASSAGGLANREATVGHLGFTGCMMWVDRVRRGYVVLLSNRVHPSRDEPRFADVRPRISDAAWTLIDARAESSGG